MPGVFAAALFFIEMALPPIQAVQFLPENEKIYAGLRINTQARCELEWFANNIGRYHQAVLALEDLRARYKVYDDARDALSTHYHILKRRLCLARVVLTLEPAAFVQGDFPQPVP